MRLTEITMMRIFRLVKFGTLAGLAIVVGAGEVLAAEASSPNYAMETSVLGAGGGDSSSPNYSVSGTVGQTVDNGTAASLNWGVDNGYFNDADLDDDGIEGPTDLCPAEFATCWDQDGDGCIDIPDPDDDMDGVSLGACDCDDSNIDIWGTPGEVLNVEMSFGPFGTSTLNWDPPVMPGGFQILYDTIRSIDPGDFVIQGECVESGDGTDTLFFEFEDPPMGEVFYYLVRARNICPAVGLLGTNSKQHLRVAKSCP